MTPRNRIPRSLTAALALIISVSCQALGAPITEDIERSFTLREGATVTVKTTNGSLRFVGVDGDQMRLRATKKARSPKDLERVRVEIEESPEGVAVETVFVSRVRNASVSYELEVPRNVEIQAKTVNGSIRISGTGGETRAKSVNGSVKIAEFAGDLSAETVNGSVQVDWRSLEGVNKNTLSTVNGSIKVRVPSDVRGGFNAKTVNGSIKTDLPLEIRKGRFGRHPSIDDRIGEHGAEFEFSTVNGGVSILTD